jgi:ectoine hydroxylase-related dioxygenase (phytanoyl-CoA dioxygenase family)
MTTTDIASVVTDDRIQQFEEQGYVLVENALEADKVAELLAAIDEVRTRLESSPHRVADAFGLNIRPVVTEHNAFLSLLEWPATFPLAVRLLRHYNIQLMTSHLIAIPPDEVQRGAGWHQDGGHPLPRLDDGRMIMQSLKVGYYLVDLEQDNMGGLMVVPGSHKRGGTPPNRADGELEGAIEVKAKAGDALFFDQRLWHAAAPNHSDQTRMILYYGYNYRQTRPIDYANMPEEIMARCSPIGQQLLGKKSSHLGYWLPTDDDVPLRAWYREHFGETWITEG